MFLPQEHGKPGMQKSVVILLGVDSFQARAEIFQGQGRVRLLEQQLIQKLLLLIGALKKAVYGDLGVGQHNQHVFVVRDLPQYGNRDVGIHKYLFAPGRQPFQELQLQHGAFLGTAVDPGLVFVGRPPDEIAPVFQVAGVGQAGELFPVQPGGQLVVVIFLTGDAAVLFRQHLHHRGFARVGGPVDEIDILPSHVLHVRWPS